MGNGVVRQDAVFELIRSMSKAEKRNFKLYATRLSGNQEAKFLSLFDCLESQSEYDEAKILQRCPIKKEQLPNMKAHLHKQILVSIRLLYVQHNVSMQLREQLDVARILFDKGLYRQCDKVLERAKEQAILHEHYAQGLEVLELQKQVAGFDSARGEAQRTVALGRVSSQLLTQLSLQNSLSNLTSQLYGLYLQLGYARTQKDVDLIVQVYEPQLQSYHYESLSTYQKITYLQASAWYHYIRHDFLACYRAACRWTALFESAPQIKMDHYELYLLGYSRLLDGLFLMRSYPRFVRVLRRFEQELLMQMPVSDNMRMLAEFIRYIHTMNRHFFEGTFEQGLQVVCEVESFAERYAVLDVRSGMLMHYKIAGLYFGAGDYRRAMEHLAQVIRVRGPQMRRDLQGYARMLNLICCYELGLDYNLDYQVKALYAFLSKMNDLQQVQREMIAFLKRIDSLYEADLREELKGLYKILKPYEDHPTERRTFYYLDVLSWLQSKMEGVTVAEVIRRRFLKQYPQG